jgi:hypothetical protein
MRDIKSARVVLASLGACALLPLPGAAFASATRVVGQPPAAQAIELTPVPGTSAALLGPGCYLSWLPEPGSRQVNAHIATISYYGHRIRVAKVNAQIRCRVTVASLYLQVTLWKTGLVFPHSQAETSVSRGRGTAVRDMGTFRRCLNDKSSTFYGTSYGSVRYGGVTYSASLETPAKVSLACGT